MKSSIKHTTMEQPINPNANKIENKKNKKVRFEDDSIYNNTLNIKKTLLIVSISILMLISMVFIFNIDKNRFDINYYKNISKDMIIKVHSIILKMKQSMKEINYNQFETTL